MGLYSQVITFQDEDPLSLQKQINDWASRGDGAEITAISLTVFVYPVNPLNPPMTVHYTALISYLKRKPDEKR